MRKTDTINDNWNDKMSSYNLDNTDWSSSRGWVSDQRHGRRRRTNRKFDSLEKLNRVHNNTMSTMMLGQYRMHNPLMNSSSTNRHSHKSRSRNNNTEKNYLSTGTVHPAWFQFPKEENLCYRNTKTSGGTFVLVTLLVVIFFYLLSPLLEQRHHHHNYFYKYNKKENGKQGIEKDESVYVKDEHEIHHILQSSFARFRQREWPFSIKDEVMDFDLIHHPYRADGDKKMYDTNESANSGDDIEAMLAVPPFFIQNDTDEKSTSSSGILGSSGKLLTRSLTNIIGIHHIHHEFGNDSSSNNDPNTRTIFVGITSYRDWRCRHTVENILSRAKYPERIRIGIVDQLDIKTDQSCIKAPKACYLDPEQMLCKHSDRIDRFELDAKHSVGSPFARHIMNRMYRGEYYFLQVNSYVKFVQDWDISIIDQHDLTENEMAVISTYLENVNDDNLSAETGEASNIAQYVICNISYEGTPKNRLLKHKKVDQPLAISQIKGSPYLHPFWSSSFSFARGHFILNVPYDPYLPFISTEDEEISMGLRAWTHGYDFYVPDKSVCFLDSFEEKVTFETSETGYIHSYLENFNQDFYENQNKKSLKRMYEIIEMGSNVPVNVWNNMETIKYGLGHVRKTQNYFSSFGIHVAERITERRLCDFITSGMMHRDFSEYLRDDGMGIDYGNINFRFHELIRIHEG